MLRKILIASCLIIASGSALANHDYVAGRVVRVEPSFSISFGGGRHHDGFRVLYESGGRQYWTHSDYRPRNVIYVPRPVYVEPVYYENYYAGPGYRRGWSHHRHHEGYGHRRFEHGWRGHHDYDD